jgi:hypothetical protein
MKRLLLALILLSSCQQKGPTIKDYYDLYFTTPKNPFK